MRHFTPSVSLLLLSLTACGDDKADTGLPPVDSPWPYTIVDSDQTDCYDGTGTATCPAVGEDYYGQDGQYIRYPPAYDSDGEIVTDLQTGLVWQWEQKDKVAWSDAAAYCEDLDLGSITDWRVPTIKQAYSLIQFYGATGTSTDETYSSVPDDAVPYIDTDAFDFSYGDTSVGERYIDTQFITSTVYVSQTFSDNDGIETGDGCFFGTNLADGRIKCYPNASEQTFQLRCVSGNEDYGINDLEDLADGTIADHATGLQWLQGDSASLDAGMMGDGTMDWGQALAWCEGLETAGYSDWRLPDAKELQSIVDYTRSPDTTGSAAMDPLFTATTITAEDGHDNYAWYWTSTTHLDGVRAGDAAAYIAFGEALGYYTGPESGQDLIMDVHGAGAQRSDPKLGDPEDYPQYGNGPQGDVRRVWNMARCVRELD